MQSTREDPWATIVIPTFNRKGFLVQAIRSALNQTVPVDVIVVDHGSSDGTEKVVSDFRDEVTYVRREFDSGPHFAWLDGALLAKTKYVKLLYDDDFLEPNFIEEAAALFTSSVGFVFTAAAVRDENGEKVFELFGNLLPTTGVYASFRSRRKVSIPVISPTSVLFRKQELVDGIFINSLPLQRNSFRGVGADHYVKLLALSRFPAFGYISEPLANFRNHPGSITVATSKNPGDKAKMQSAYSDVATAALVFGVASRLKLFRAARFFETLTTRFSPLVMVLQAIRLLRGKSISGAAKLKA